MSAVPNVMSEKLQAENKKDRGIACGIPNEHLSNLDPTDIEHDIDFIPVHPFFADDITEDPIGVFRWSAFVPIGLETANQIPPGDVLNMIFRHPRLPFHLHILLPVVPDHILVHSEEMMKHLKMERPKEAVGYRKHDAAICEWTCIPFEPRTKHNALTTKRFLTEAELAVNQFRILWCNITNPAMDRHRLMAIFTLLRLDQIMISQYTRGLPRDHSLAPQLEHRTIMDLLVAINRRFDFNDLPQELNLADVGALKADDPHDWKYIDTLKEGDEKYKLTQDNHDKRNFKALDNWWWWDRYQRLEMEWLAKLRMQDLLQEGPMDAETRPTDHDGVLLWPDLFHHDPAVEIDLMDTRQNLNKLQAMKEIKRLVSASDIKRVNGNPWTRSEKHDGHDGMGRQRWGWWVTRHAVPYDFSGLEPPCLGFNPPPGYVGEHGNGKGQWKSIVGAMKKKTENARKSTKRKEKKKNGGKGDGEDGDDDGNGGDGAPGPNGVGSSGSASNNRGGPKSNSAGSQSKGKPQAVTIMSGRSSPTRPRKDQTVPMMLPSGSASLVSPGFTVHWDPMEIDDEDSAPSERLSSQSSTISTATIQTEDFETIFPLTLNPSTDCKRGRASTDAELAAAMKQMTLADTAPQANTIELVPGDPPRWATCRITDIIKPPFSPPAWKYDMTLDFAADTKRLRRWNIWTVGDFPRNATEFNLYGRIDRRCIVAAIRESGGTIKDGSTPPQLFQMVEKMREEQAAKKPKGWVDDKKWFSFVLDDGRCTLLDSLSPEARKEQRKEYIKAARMRLVVEGKATPEQAAAVQNSKAMYAQKHGSSHTKQKSHGDEANTGFRTKSGAAASSSDTTKPTAKKVPRKPAAPKKPLNSKSAVAATETPSSAPAASARAKSRSEEAAEEEDDDSFLANELEAGLQDEGGPITCDVPQDEEEISEED